MQIWTFQANSNASSGNTKQTTLVNLNLTVDDFNESVVNALEKPIQHHLSYFRKLKNELLPGAAVLVLDATENSRFLV